MKIITKDIHTDSINLFPMSDVHVGKINCAEEAFKKYVQLIKESDNQVIIGMGDYIDAIKPSDIKRFDPRVLPNWILEQAPDDMRDSLSNIVMEQAKRFLKFVKPVDDKFVGLIEGNHEDCIRKYHNEYIQGYLAGMLGVPNLTDKAIVSLRFFRCNKQRHTYNIYVQHGNGGGRSDGIEPNKLGDIIKRVGGIDLVMRGHSHIPCYIAKDRMEFTHGNITPKTIRGLNPGAFIMNYSDGPATYESRADYPSKPLITYYVKLTHKMTDGKSRILTEVKEVEF